MNLSLTRLFFDVWKTTKNSGLHANPSVCLKIINECKSLCLNVHGSRV